MTMQLNNDLSICSDKITSSSEMFGDQETLELMDILAQYLGRSNALFSYNFYSHAQLKFQENTSGPAGPYVFRFVHQQKYFSEKHGKLVAN